MISLVPSGLQQLIHQSFGVGMTCGRRRVSRDHSSVGIVNGECGECALKPISITDTVLPLQPNDCNGNAFRSLIAHQHFAKRNGNALSLSYPNVLSCYFRDTSYINRMYVVFNAFRNLQSRFTVEMTSMC
jgi:hypothetical protein